jgi:magnesium chelatase family protein
MLASGLAATPWGISARPVQVEVDVQPSGIPSTHIVGLPDTAVRESRERIRAAIKNCGFSLQRKATVINLAPADVRKEGNLLDLAIALTLLAAREVLRQSALDGRMLCGELGLDGTIRPIRGALAIAELARRLDLRELLVPVENAAEAVAVGDLRVIPVPGLSAAIGHLVGNRPLAPAEVRAEASRTTVRRPDLADVRGQEHAKRALEIAAAGSHNLLFIGPPGAGKTLLAQRLPGLLPPLSRTESIEVTKIHSLSAREPPEGLIEDRPFRSPHAGTSAAGMAGGGPIPRPGEVTMAHRGVLFLDELPEFRRDVLETLRQPLEDGRISIVRARARIRFPARFALLAAMNPCPCGHLGDSRHECRCGPTEIERYRARISGPLLDRIDLHVEVPAVSLAELKRSGGEGTIAVAERVLAARARQRRRYADLRSATTNASLEAGLLRQACPLDGPAQRLLDHAFERLGLSVRAVTRILKVSRTIADLAGREPIAAEDVAEAIQHRSLDRRAEG